MCCSVSVSVSVSLSVPELVTDLEGLRREMMCVV